MKRLLMTLALLALPFGTALAAEVALVTRVSGAAVLVDGTAEAPLQAFVKLRDTDAVRLAADARVQLVYFNGGREESWQGAVRLKVGATASSADGGAAPSVRLLPAILVKQLARTPGPDGNVRSGMVRMRSMPTGGTIESVEKQYQELRAQASGDDRNPELYLLSGYFELREFDKLNGLLDRLTRAAPGDGEVKRLASLYARAVNNARMAEK